MSARVPAPRSLAVWAVALALCSTAGASTIERELVLPFEQLHNHGSSIVEAADGTLFVVWFRGSGERKSDDVAIFGSRKPPGGQWSEPFVVADQPGFPDTNSTLLVDARGRLWLFWPTILANLWESALLKYKVAEDWAEGPGPPEWQRSEVLHFKPGDDFPEVVERKTDAYLASLGLDLESAPESTLRWREHNLEQAADKLTRRLGWFTRPHPIQLPDGRIVVGVYSDGFSFSAVTYTDDDGRHWTMSEPIVGGGAVQPSLLRRQDGTLVAFMRDNGPPPKLVLVAESEDQGATWGLVRDHADLADSGAGVDALALEDGRWLIFHNDLSRGRHRLTVSISDDEGLSFKRKRIVEEGSPEADRYHYPSAIQSRDSSIHLTYSVHETRDGAQRKSIRHTWFDLAWLDGAQAP